MRSRLAPKCEPLVVVVKWIPPCSPSGSSLNVFGGGSKSLEPETPVSPDRCPKTDRTTHIGDPSFRQFWSPGGVEEHTENHTSDTIRFCCFGSSHPLDHPPPHLSPQCDRHRFCILRWGGRLNYRKYMTGRRPSQLQRSVCVCFLTVTDFL